MVKIVVDDPLVELKLRELLALVESNGARFHSEMTIASSENEFRIETRLEPGNAEPVIYIPDTCLPRVDDFHIKLEGNDLDLEPRSDNVSRLHIDVFEKILEIYNLTEKVKTHKKTFPMLVLANNKDILESLNKGTLIADQYYAHLNNDNMEYLIKSTFFGARNIKHNYQDGNRKRGAIMPVIDFVNHHGLASNYLNASTESEISEGLMIRNSKPIPDSYECFVRYNKLDALSAYMFYGFVGTTAPALRSIPLVLSVQGAGTIEVDSDVFYDDVTGLPPEYLDIQYYFPHIKRAEKQNLHVSHLMIPSDGNSEPLRRVLQFFINVLIPNTPKKMIKKLARKAEEQVLNKNINYYAKLKELVEDEFAETIADNKFDTLNQLIQLQQKCLLNYRKRNL